MKHILCLLLIIASLTAYGQTDGSNLPDITTPQNTDAVITANRGQFMEIRLDTLKTYFEQDALDTLYTSNDTLFALRGDGTSFFAVLPGAGSISDGDKGDITVASGVWTIDTGAITWAKLAGAVQDSIQAGGSGEGDVTTAQLADSTAAVRAAIPDVSGYATQSALVDTAAAIRGDFPTDTDTQLSQEQVEDYAGAMFTGNTETLITATYQDADGTVDLVVNDDLSQYDNTTSGFITNSVLADSTAAVRADFPAGGSGSPGGVSGSVQVNDGAGGFTGNAAFTYESIDTTLVVDGRMEVGDASGSYTDQKLFVDGVWYETDEAAYGGVFDLTSLGDIRSFPLDVRYDYSSTSTSASISGVRILNASIGNNTNAALSFSSKYVPDDRNYVYGSMATIFRNQTTGKGDYAFLLRDGANLYQRFKITAEGSYIAPGNTTANRPAGTFGENYNNTTLSRPQFYDGTSWKDYLLTADVVYSSTAPSDTTDLWVDNTNAVFAYYPAKVRIKGAWRTIGYWDAVAVKWREEPCEVHLASGQSNVLGGSGTTPSDTETEPLFQAWNGTAWVTASPTSAPFTSGRSSYVFYMGRERARRTGKVVRVVISALDGSPISDWVPDTGTRYVSIQNQTAASGVDDNGGYDYFSFFQGEADRTELPENYKLKVDTLISQLRAETWWKANTPMFFITPYDGVNSIDRRNMAQVHRIWSNDSDPLTHSVLTGDLSTISDYIHLDSLGQKNLGKRIVEMMERGQDSWFRTEFPDSTQINAMYELDGLIRVRKIDSSNDLSIPFLWGKDGGLYKFKVETTDSIDIELNNITLLNPSGDTLQAWRAKPGFYDAYFHRDTLQFLTSVLEGDYTIPSDTMSIASPSNRSDLVNTAPGIWESTNATLWNGYGVWDQYSPTGYATTAQVDVEASGDEGVMIGFDNSTTVDWFDVTSGSWQYAVYHNGTNFGTIENGVATTRATYNFTYGGGEKMALKRTTGGTITAEYYDGSTWNVIYTFPTTSTAAKYLKIAVQSPSKQAVNPRCFECINR